MATSLKNIKYRVENLEIHSDERGWLVELLKANRLEKPVKQLHIASIRVGKIRGNHYHNKRIEWFFLVKGRVRLTLEDIKTKKRVSFDLSSRNPKVVTAFPCIAHALKNTGKETAYLVAAQSDLYDPKNPDRFFYSVL